MPKRLYYRAALILVFPVVFLQLIVSIVFIQRHFEGVTVQMTRTVAAELDLITEVIERDGAVAAQQIAKSLGMSMSIVSQETNFSERRRVYDLTGLVVRRELLCGGGMDAAAYSRSAHSSMCARTMFAGFVAPLVSVDGVYMGNISSEVTK